MNLRNIANKAIQAINPDQTITWKRSTGWQIVDFVQVPSYEEIECLGNVQALSDAQLKHANDMNLSGVMRSVYLSQNAMGVSFRQIRGGDILSFREFEDIEPTEWKVVHSAETWDNWCHVIVVQQ